MDSNNTIVPGFDDEQNDDLKISLQKIPTVKNGCLVTLTGIIDTYNSSFFQNQITKVITTGYINIIFKCTFLDYIASTGLGNFTNILKIIRSVGGDFVISDIQPKIEEYFTLLGFSQFFVLRQNTQLAIDYFINKDRPGGAVFPKLSTCPVCKKTLKLEKACKVMCPSCSSILIITDTGDVIRN